MFRWSPSLAAAVSCSLFAACGSEPRSAAGPIYAEAIAQLAPIRPRTLIDPNSADPKDLNANTADWPIEGSARFRTTSDGVDVALQLRVCRLPYNYPVRIYDTLDCASLTRDSQPWDSLADDFYCLATAGGSAFESRVNSAAKPWSLGGGTSSDLLGRTLAVLDPDTGEPLLCARIEVSAAGKLAETERLAEPPAHAVVFALGSLCVFSGLPESARACEAAQQLDACVLKHCVAPCLDRCEDYTRCLASASDTCSNECRANDECSTCLGSQACALGFCAKNIACVPPPTPGGPCSELRECCTRQGPLTASCLKLVDTAETLSGDATCTGTLYDWDFNTNYAYRSPCYPEGFDPEL